MKKNFVFDTNVLLADARAVHRFGDNNIVIPITVIEELDKFKKDLNGLGRNAREVSRMMDGFRAQGSLAHGVELPNGGTVRVMTDLGKEPPIPFPTMGKTADTLILAAALKLAAEERKKDEAERLPVIFVTRDINLRLRADAVGLTAVNYHEEDQVEVEEMYSGCREVETSGETIDRYLDCRFLEVEADTDLRSNECVVFVDPADPEHTASGRYSAARNGVAPLIDEKEVVSGIIARNREQLFALDLLLDDNVQVVTISGKAGTGKTLLAIAAGLRKVTKGKVYTKLVVARPVMPLGKELGFLPGAIDQKLRPWMEPVFDNLEFLMGVNKAKKEQKRPNPTPRERRKRKEREPSSNAAIKKLLDSGVLDVQALTYIRGRSLPRQFLIIDEAQNLTLHEAKTIITRAGEGTKVIMTGDPYQIDNPYLDISNNGLTAVAERFKGQSLAGHITLTKGERSALAEMASDLL